MEYRMMNGTLYLRVDPGESLCKSILEDPQIISTGVVAIFTAPEKIGRRLDAGAGIGVWDFSGDPEAAPCRKEDAV